MALFRNKRVISSKIKEEKSIPVMGLVLSEPSNCAAGRSTMILGYLAVTAVSGYVYYLTWKKVRQDQIEMRSARLALQPLLTAERDREFLNQLRRNRDEEAKLMANVPGWEVGTWYGEPVYKTLPPDTLVTPYIYEFYAHASDSEFKRRTTLVLWS
ncbi:NADH dehydrogenase [ubiquinone] 1 alpha subcomplex subunit 13 [Cryptotermes secundus]|uniref:NADH dehydrogenase [ubiquinone] 1 alpha subcomplex subunit 13 n=1 Tax=Cryptotermes secundus TaxID=105785 RepID=A0A2J7R267_9NEOP|nr:NADH dehydrogenase [ubiquinone] 1 alpha subcomplex subunit 13 [Cryptotermes secundus]